MLKANPLTLFNVRRCEPELIAPAKPTPRGIKPLSNIDDQESLRFLIPVMLFYPGDSNANPRDPVKAIREALAQLLVYYYPLAGRLREGPRRKLLVDCTGEGVVFVEADADFTLEDLSRENGVLRPPFPCELLFDVPGSSDILNSPLLLIQVTRFRCGGFLFAMRWNHTVTGGASAVQFIKSLTALSREASEPEVLPVWSRELLLERDPPCVPCTHREYDQVVGTAFPIVYSDERVIERSFFFGPAELSAIQSRLLQPHLKHYSTIDLDLLSAFLWRCRTLALRYDPREEVQYLRLTNARSSIPDGYYGNTFVLPAAVSASAKLTSNGLDYAVELIKKAKSEVTDEYVRSVIDLMSTHDRPHFTVPGSWQPSNATQAGYLEMDFGWGKPVYGGPATAMVGVVPGPISFFVKGKNREGEIGVFLLICLPETAMERFAREVESVGNARDRSSNYVAPRL